MRKDMIVIKKALLAAAAVLLTIHAGGASMEAYAHHGATGHHGYVFSDDAEDGPGSLGAWEHDGSCWRYREQDGGYASNCWKHIRGTDYCFDAEGRMMADCLAQKDGKLCYLGDKGWMLRNKEICVGGTCYVIGEDGTARPASEISEYDEAAMGYARELIGSIVNDSMTEQQKADAIYDHVRYMMAYTANGPLSDCAYGAAYVFRRKSGNCFEYAAVSHYLLGAAGFDDIIVANHDSGHFWNLVRTSEGWRHFDTTPWDGFDRLCLRDTAFLEENYWTTYRFDKDAYPGSQA